MRHDAVEIILYGTLEDMTYDAFKRWEIFFQQSVFGSCSHWRHKASEIARLVTLAPTPLPHVYTIKQTLRTSTITGRREYIFFSKFHRFFN